MKKLLKITVVKSVAAVLAVIMSLGVLSACSNSNSSNKNNGQKLTITISSQNQIGPNENSPTYAEEKKHLEEIEEKYNVKLNFNIVPDWAKFHDSYWRSTLAGEVYADVAFLDYALTVPYYVVNGLVGEISDNWKIDGTTWDTEKSKLLNFNGKQYGLVLKEEIEPNEVIFFNKRLIKETFGDENYLYDLYDAGNWTWDTFLASAKKLTTGQGDSKVYGTGGYGPVGTILETMFLASNNGGWVKKTGENAAEFNLDNAESQQAMQFVYDLYYKENVAEPLTEANNNWDYTKGKFVNGEIAMFGAQLWQAGIFKEEMKNDKYGILPAPKAPGKEAKYSKSSVMVAFIPPKAKQSELIAQVVTEYFAPQSWKPSLEERVEKYVYDEKSLEIIKDISDDLKIEELSGITSKYSMEKSDYGILTKQTPSQFAASVKPEVQSLIDGAFKKDEE